MDIYGLYQYKYLRVIEISIHQVSFYRETCLIRISWWPSKYYKNWREHFTVDKWTLQCFLVDKLCNDDKHMFYNGTGNENFNSFQVGNSQTHFYVDGEIYFSMFCWILTFCKDSEVVCWCSSTLWLSARHCKCLEVWPSIFDQLFKLKSNIKTIKQAERQKEKHHLLIVFFNPSCT